MLSDQLHPMAPHHLPFYITSPGETDALMIGTGIFLVAAVFAVGLLYWHLHSLPERMAHKTQKLQFEVVAVLGLIALFTHEHLYWIAALVLALIELPDFGTPLRSIAGSVEKIADGTPSMSEDDISQPNAAVAPMAVGRNERDLDADQKVRSHA